MTTQSEMFGRLLRGAINSIAAYEGKTAAAVEQELGTAIGLSGAAIQRYKAGTLPPEPRTIQILAEASIQRGYLGRAWLQRFLQAAQFPMAADLIARLIGDGTTILPSGTLAFLFTDIAGSTQRWENERAMMEQALIRHDTLMRQAIELSGGQVFKTVGDAFYAVFATAPQALDAAIAAQRAILAEPWSTSTPIQVRMAIHVGAADPHDGDYFGAPLNRVARLCAAGHGGQMLLSAAAWELVRDQLPEAVTLRELGERRLKDLGRPERIFQVVALDLPTEFPRLNALDRYRHNLPPQATMLIGRERETRIVCDMLCAPATRLLTLTGPGGIGKTRLALQVAADLLDAYPDGVWFVALAALRDPDRLAEQIATMLAVPSNDGRPVVEHVRTFLRHKSLLLVLDNFEQIAEAAPLVAELLADAPGVKALVTSRTVLHLYGEREFAVPPLGLPDPQRPPTPERLAQYDALRLFIERAQAVRPDFVVTNETAPVIAEICARLDGLPLAIELAAARSRIFPPRALLARLDRRLSILTGGARDRPARHQTLRDTISWSYDMLDIAEQTLFARLGVFTDGWTLEAADSVCGSQLVELPALALSLPTETIAGLLESLASQSLIGMVERPHSEPRFTMLETLREFALEQLDLNDSSVLMQRAHAEYFCSLSETAATKLKGDEQLVWFDRLTSDYTNLCSALSWSRIGGSAELTLRLVSSLMPFWVMRGHFFPLRSWLRSLLMPLPHDMPLISRACWLNLASDLYDNPDQAYALQEESVAIFRTLEDGCNLAQALNVLANYSYACGEFLRAWQQKEEALALGRMHGQIDLVAFTLNGIGDVAREQGEYQVARTAFSESITLGRAQQNRAVLSMALSGYGDLALYEGQVAEASIRYQEALDLGRAIGSVHLVGWALRNLGRAAHARGNESQAIALITEGLSVFHDGSIKYGAGCCLEALAGALGAQGLLVPAARLFGAGQAQRVGWTRFSWPLAARVDYERDMVTVRDQLGPEAFDSAWAGGAQLSLDQAVAEGLAYVQP